MFKISQCELVLYVLNYEELKWRDNANNFEVNDRVFLSNKKYTPIYTFLDRGRQTTPYRVGNKTTNSRFSSKPEIESTPRICLARKVREKFGIVRANFVLAESAAPSNSVDAVV